MRFSRLAPLASLAAAAALLHGTLPPGATRAAGQAPVSRNRDAGASHNRFRPAHNNRLPHMANVQITAGGPAVSVPITLDGRIATANYIGVGLAKPDGSSYGSANTIPGPGQSTAPLGNHVNCTNTGQAVTVAGQTYYVFSLQADAGTPPGVGYTLEQDANGGGGAGHAPFDVLAPPGPPPPPSAPGAPAFSAVFPTAVVVITAPLPSGATTLGLQRAPDAAGAPGAWATPPDGNMVTPSSAAVDSGLTPGATYHYRFAAAGPGGTTYGPESGPVTTGAITMSQQTAPDPSYTPSGMVSKLGIALEPTPGAAVKAGRLLDRVVGNLQADNKRLPSKATHNHPGRVRSVLGPGKTDGQITIEATPEGMDEILAMICGAPVSAAASTASTASSPAGVPQAPAGLSVIQIGAAGAANASYTVIARNAQGDSVASAAVVTNTGNAAPGAANFNQVACAPVLTATSYVFLKGGQLLGVSQYPWLNDVGQVTSAYAAPPAPVGFVNTYKLALARLTASISDHRGDSIFLYEGASCNKLSLKYDKTQGDPFNFVADFVALCETLGYTEAQLGLDTAGTDPLGNFSVAMSCKTYIAGAIADAQSWGADIDSNLGEKHSLRGYIGPAGHFKQGSNHGLTASLYFSSEAEYQRYLGVLPGSTSGPYGAAGAIQLFPVAIVLTMPVNAAGIVNEFRLLLPSCEYEMVGPKYPGKDGAVMQDCTLYPCIDPVTGTDVIFQTVNSRSNVGAQTTPLVTGVPANAVFAYTS